VATVFTFNESGFGNKLLNSEIILSTYQFPALFSILTVSNESLYGLTRVNINHVKPTGGLNWYKPLQD